MTSADEWSDAPQQGGEYLKPVNIMGHLLIVYPIGYIENFPTSNSRPDRPSDAIECDVVDLDTPDPSTGQPGRLWRNQKFLQSQLIMSLRPMIGRRVLGRMNKGVAKPGFNPPWVLDPMSADPQALERGKAWTAAHPDFKPSEFIPWTPRAQAPPIVQQAPQGYPQQYQQPTFAGPPQPPPYQQPQQPQQYPPQQPYGPPAQPYPPQPQYAPDPWTQAAAPPDPWGAQGPPPDWAVGTTAPVNQPPPAAPMVPVAGTRPLTMQEAAELERLRNTDDADILERLRRARQLQGSEQPQASQSDERQRFGF